MEGDLENRTREVSVGLRRRWADYVLPATLHSWWICLIRHLIVGWVYTRLVFKGAYVLSRFHDYEREWEVLVELLDQKLFRRGRRGEWWERRALIEVSLPVCLI